jgi:hypothetical protein
VPTLFNSESGKPGKSSYSGRAALQQDFDTVYEDLPFDPNIPLVVVAVKKGEAAVYVMDFSNLQGRYTRLTNSEISALYRENVSDFRYRLEGNVLHYSWYRPIVGHCSYRLNLVTKEKSAD